MHVPSLSMSNIVSNDNALSPVSDWDSNSHFSHSGVDALSAINFSNFSLPSPPLSMGSRMHSPMPTSKMLKSRLSPDASDSEHQLCVPTHQVFDVPPLPTDSAEEVEESILPQRDDCSRSSSPASVVPAKRPSSTATAPSKKARSGERITTKDFVPPDVTGLSKREARLVKNRAAAFLSRQRKREEFENMEVRVAELEQENARLQAITQGNNEGDHNEDLLSEVEQLRLQPPFDRTTGQDGDL
ncbi:hypothetical protein NLI96_g9278 [Meripilus lineatus]|uniref:BZIP domain-containing protein n=1 Tax=Meripilus lineatus TaxID=2056292 RepID=A0AAD5YD30_9APHY|nr:hypothetical protein NLI96_g9278 [Physisporinus lineatus]